MLSLATDFIKLYRPRGLHHYFILVFGWVGGGMGGISLYSGFVSPFSCFVSIDFSVLM